jgi:hypothetical protein
LVERFIEIWRAIIAALSTPRVLATTRFIPGHKYSPI